MSKPKLPAAAWLARIFTIALGLAVFLDQAGAGWLIDDYGPGEAELMSPAHWVELIAPAFFLWALWAASNVSVRIGRGDAFGAAMVRGLREIGTALMLGAFAALVVQPSLIHLIGNGFAVMKGVRFDLTVQNLTLILVGLLLVLLARQGQALKSRLEEFV